VKDIMDVSNKDYSDKSEIDEAKKLIDEITNFQFGNLVKSGSETNTISLQSENISFVKRFDSRAYFLQNIKYGLNKD